MKPRQSTSKQPPRYPTSFLKMLVAPHLREEILGDLQERYVKRMQMYGAAKASRRYWLESLAYIRPAFIKRQKSEYKTPSLLSPAMIKNYFKIAFRNLVKSKGYSAINITGLSIGLACAMMIMLYVKDELTYDRFHANGNQIFRVVRRLVNPDGSIAGSDGYTGYPQGPRFTEGTPEIKGFVRLQNGYRDIKTGTEIQSQQVIYVDSNFLSAFSFPLLSRNPKSALLAPNCIVISEQVALRQFGTTEALGKTIQISNGEQFEPFSVTGVARDCPQNSSIKFHVLLPLQVKASDASGDEAWLNVFLNTFLILDPKADTKLTEARIKRVFETNAAEALKIGKEKYDVKWSTSYLLQPVTDMHLSKEFPPIDGLMDASSPLFSYLLSGIAIFILLIACINFINLTVVRSIGRAKEIGVRKVVGSSRAQLIIQFLGESFILCLSAFLLALILVQIMLPFFNELFHKTLSLSYLFDFQLIIGYLILFILTTMLAGFYPSIVLSGYNPMETLYSKLSVGGKGYLQKSLVVFQFSLASFMIMATFVISGQFNYLTNEKLGYDDNNLVAVNQWGITPGQIELFKQGLSKNASIVGVAAKDMGYDNGQVKVNGEDKIAIVRETVDKNYIPLLKIGLVRGRNFSKLFASDSTEAVLVNEAFVKKAGWKEPLGQELDFYYLQEKFRVIGVVKDYHFQSLNEAIKPQVFCMKPGRVFGNLLIKIKPGKETAGIKKIEQTFKSIFPLSPFSYTFKSQENLSNYHSEQNWKQIMLFGAVITIFISCIGLFGLSVLSAESRTKEIGIRKVLGASVGAILTVLSVDMLKLIILSLVIAVPVSWLAAEQWLQNYPYRIALSWQLFISGGMMVIVIALLTISFQSLKAALVNPVKSLRSE